MSVHYGGKGPGHLSRWPKAAGVYQEGFVLTSGDAQSGTDRILLSGDAQSGTDKLIYGGIHYGG